jgi:hypothetical protein
VKPNKRFKVSGGKTISFGVSENEKDPERGLFTMH